MSQTDRQKIWTNIEDDFLYLQEYHNWLCPNEFKFVQNKK
jgi:hypothetical protein